MRHTIVTCDLCGKEIDRCKEDGFKFRYQEKLLLNGWTYKDCHVDCFHAMRKYICLMNNDAAIDAINTVISNVQKEFNDKNIKLRDEKHIFDKEKLNVSVSDEDHIWINGVKYISLDRFSKALHTEIYDYLENNK